MTQRDMLRKEPWPLSEARIRNLRCWVYVNLQSALCAPTLACGPTFVARECCTIRDRSQSGNFVRVALFCVAAQQAGFKVPCTEFQHSREIAKLILLALKEST